MKIGRKVPPRGNGKQTGGIPLMRPHHKDGVNTDRMGKPVTISASSIYLWHESHKEFGAKFTVIISVPVNTIHCYRRGCKEYISTTEKWLRNQYLQHEQHPHER